MPASPRTTPATPGARPAPHPGRAPVSAQGEGPSADERCGAAEAATWADDGGSWDEPDTGPAAARGED